MIMHATPADANLLGSVRSASSEVTLLRPPVLELSSNGSAARRRKAGSDFPPTSSVGP